MILVWLAGWALYWGSSQNSGRERKTIVEDDGLEMGVTIFEECPESKD
jgi:hypothetical protein